MERKTLMTTTAAALIAAPTLLVADIPAPAAAESSPNPADDVRVEENTASYDGADSGTPMIENSGMNKDVYSAVLDASGSTFATVDGDTIGVIENVTVDNQGNAELIVDIADDATIEADVLVVEVEQGKVSMVNDALLLETSLGELRTAASTDAGRHPDGRVEITF